MKLQKVITRETAKALYNEWRERENIEAMTDEEISLHFGRVIGFGTAGLRGKMLPGIANMNDRTVAVATKALADLVIEAGGEKSGVVIAYDSRNNSDYFSAVAARVLAAAGVKVYIFDALRPTPELSFAIRELRCKAGINVTASHNTKEYNGYKVYWEDGAQLPPEHAKKVADKFYDIDIWNIELLDYDEGVRSGIIEVVGSELDEKYLEKVLEQSVSPETVKAHSDELDILYTPLHGAGYTLVPEVLFRAGFKKVRDVECQSHPDGEFPTLTRPNPQYLEAFSTAIDIASGADVIIATDPDADRMGIAVKDKSGEYKTLTGNQIALVLIDYIIKAKKMPEKPAMVKSIVSSALAEVICKKNNVEVFNVYTGFKYIGEKIKEFEESGSHSFIFGFEESHGYLTGTYARDKDGILASLLIAEAALFAKLEGKTLFDVLDEIYEVYGFFGEYSGEAVITAPNFTEVMDSTMKRLRLEPPKEIAGHGVVKITDYESAKETELISGKVTPLPFPSENVLTYTLDDGSSVIIRPSGTEPKIKLYYFISAKDSAESLEKLEKLKSYFNF